MSPAEVGWRALEQARRAAWSRRQVKPGEIAEALPTPGRPLTFANVLPPQTAERVPDQARKAVLAAADRLMRGEWEVFGVVRTDLARPDWFRDPVTGRRSPQDRYAFRINHRSEDLTGNVKQLWEVSRLQHLTLLATAWYLSHEESYARRVAEQLRSWWRENPYLSGVHWTSGIEVGIRLVSFAWIRRLLDGWPGVADLYEHSQLAVQQVRWHQQYIAAFPSRGSSANNHVVAEVAGQLVASCAFPWFPQSHRWRERAARLLERELVRNTFPSGIGRELASDYQGFVAELGLVAAVEAEAYGRPLSPTTWQRLCAMIDSGAALLDERMRQPRQGDGDEARALLLDAPASNTWPSLLGLGRELVGNLDWWPSVAGDARSALVAAMAGARRDLPGRPRQRPARFAGAGITLLRTADKNEPEIWCRCDGGPHGYLSIAAHAHADALSVEVRYGGVDILADPGTYCYHGEPEWRSYFRSTIAHNTVEVGGRSQSADGGPFLWLRHANGRELQLTDDGKTATWAAEHDGYRSLRPPTVHRRTVRLDRASRALDVVDMIDRSGLDIRIAFHFGPDVLVELDGRYAMLSWPDAAAPGSARLELPAELEWSLRRGDTAPVLGWFSGGFGRRVPAFALIGRGISARHQAFSTRLDFLGGDRRAESSFTSAAVSSSAPSALMNETRKAIGWRDERAGA